MGYAGVLIDYGDVVFGALIFVILCNIMGDWLVCGINVLCCIRLWSIDYPFAGC